MFVMQAEHDMVTQTDVTHNTKVNKYCQVARLELLSTIEDEIKGQHGLT